MLVLVFPCYVITIIRSKEIQRYECDQLILDMMVIVTVALLLSLLVVGLSVPYLKTYKLILQH